MMMNKPLPRLLAAATLLWSLSPGVQAQITPASAYPVAPAAGLYQALGEQGGIRLLMDDLVARLRRDARLAGHFRDSKPEHLAGQLTAQVCQLAGGPCRYEGPTMAEAHQGLTISKADFNALVELLQQSMDARGLAFGRQNQLLALLAPLHRDVITER